MLPSIGAIAKGFGGIALAAVAAGGAITAFGIKGAANLETTTVAFTSLLSSSKKATDQIAELQKFAAKTPFSQQDVFNYAQQYFALADSVGLAKDQVEPFLTAVGDIAAVTGASTENIHNAVLAIGQIGSAGKVTLENLNQISEAFPGFNGAAAIASATGQTTAETLKEISAGSIDAETGIRALLVGMQKFKGASGAMAKQSKTLTGLFSTFKDTISIKLTQAFGPLIPTIKTLLADLVPVVSSALDTLAPALTGFVKTLIPVLTPLIKGLSTVFASVFKALGPALADLAPIIQPLAQTFAAVAAAAAPLLRLFAQILAQLGPPVLALFRNLLSAVRPVVRALSDALAPVLPIIAQALRQITQALRPVLRQLGQAFADAIAAVAPSLPGLAKALADLAVALVDLLVPLTPLLVDFIKFQNLLSVPVVKSVTVLAQALTLLVRGAKSLFGWLGGLVKLLSGPLTAAFHAMAGPVKAFIALLKPLVKVIGAINKFTGATNFAKGAISAVGGVLGSTTDGIGTLSGGLVTAANGANALATSLDRVKVSSAEMADQILASHAADLLHQLQTGVISQAEFDKQLEAARHAAASKTPKVPTVPPLDFPDLKIPKLKLPGSGDVATPFDKGTISAFLQQALGINPSPLISSLNSIIQSAASAGKKLSTAFIAQLRGDTRELASLTRERERVAETLQKVQEEITTVRSTTRGTFDITTAGQNDFGEPVTFFDIRSAIATAVRNASRFVRVLKRLLREGLNGQLVAQLAEAGPTALPQAQALLSATPKQLNGLNRQFRKLNRLGGEVGKISATALFGAGAKSVDGFINGLKSRESALTKAIRRLARGMVSELRRVLDIHSPSRVMHDLGAFSGEGFRRGLESKYAAVVAASNRLANGTTVPVSQMRAWQGGSGGDEITIHQHTHNPVPETRTRSEAAMLRSARNALGR